MEELETPGFGEDDNKPYLLTRGDAELWKLTADMLLAVYRDITSQWKLLKIISIIITIQSALLAILIIKTIY